jgi:2-iminobutanoate/2-iminopropanoate deaminase
MKYFDSLPNLPAAIGPYSVCTQHNGLIFFSGQIGINPETGVLAGETVALQTQQIIKNIKALFSALKIGPENVCKTTIFLSDMSYFSEVNEIYSSLFKENKPARSTIGVLALPLNAKVEIEMIAASE